MRESRKNAAREEQAEMECEKCGRELAEGVSFCPYCGEKVDGAKAGGEKTVGEKPGAEKPVYVADVKGLLKSGQLAVYRDRAEFITSSVQKTVFDYSALISVKKGLDRISFITEDGRTESCAVNRKNIHEAFLYIEKASEPYIEERKKRLRSQGIEYSLASSQGLTGGILNILEDRAEFISRSGQSDIIRFRDVKSVGASMGGLDFFLVDGGTKSFTADRDIRGEVLSFLEEAIAPCLAERKEALLAGGIYYSFPGNYGPVDGTVHILEDRVEFIPAPGQKVQVFFRDVRTAGVFMGALELALTDGTSRSFTVERDVQDEVLSFVEHAIRPYVLERTVGFEKVFGVDERIEINEERGVFHIIRQGGNEISEEYSTECLLKCERTECSVSGGVLLGGRAILNGVARAAGTQNVPKPGDILSYAGVVLTIRSGQGERTECVRFGDFSLGMNRTGKKYDRYAAEISRFMEYLGDCFPACELVTPAFAEEEGTDDKTRMEITDGGQAGAAGDTPMEESVSSGKSEASVTAGTAAERDQFGIIKYIEGVAEFIGECETPMTIAIQGAAESDRNTILKMLSDSLEAGKTGAPVWFHTWQFAREDSDGQLPTLIAGSLMSQLDDAGGAVVKDRAIRVAKGLINITSGFLSQGSTDGQNLMDALFRDDSANSPEKLAQNFLALVNKRAGGENGRVIIILDDLDSLPPVRQVELLEAMRYFFGCRGCVFVLSVDYNAILRGVREKYGPDDGENRGKSFFDRVFQVSFRVPAFGYNIQNYVKDRLAHMEIQAEETETESCAELIRHSVGSEQGSMDRLFHSFRLLRRLAGEEIYGNRNRRLMLFSLLCMQAEFPDVYDLIVGMRDRVTSAFLTGMCDERSEIWKELNLSGERKKKFCDFAEVFCEVINTDRTEGISEEECRAFTEVLEVSCITSK